MDKLKIALVGAGNRASGTYAPIITTMTDDLELVAICDVAEEKAKERGEQYNVPYFTNVEEMAEKTKPDIAAVVITPSRNHEAGIPLSKMGVSYCTETPIDTNLWWADEMIRVAKETNTKLEVCENYYRFPGERIKREMILAGVFGKVLTAYNDFRGHGYHGVGLIRSYIGLDVSAVRVIGMTKNFKVQEHLFRAGQPSRSDENWQHGIIEFENGSVGIFNFTSLSYGSPMRWYNTSKFYAERGMCVREEAAILNDTADGKRPINVERRTTKAQDGKEVLDCFVADTTPEVVWKNPLSKYPLNDGQLSVASEVMSIANAVRNDTEPEYGALNGRIDREVDLAIFKSAGNNNQPVELPLPVEKPEGVE